MNKALGVPMFPSGIPTDNQPRSKRAAAIRCQLPVSLSACMFESCTNETLLQYDPRKLHIDRPRNDDGQKNSMASTLASTKHNFTNLPPEIRNMVYSLLLRLERPVSICSLRRKRWPSKPQPACPIDSEKDRPRVTDPHFSCLLQVNKQVHHEASKIFFSENVFVLGNGSYGSTTQTNIHGMMTFIKRVPAHFLASIKNIIVFIHLRSAWLPFPLNPNKFCVGSKNDTDALQSISRALVKHFTGLRLLEYKISVQGPPFSYDPTGNLFTKTALKETEAQLQLSRMISMLSKHKNLQKVELEKSTWVDLQKVVHHFQQKNPDLSLVSKVVLKSISQHP